MTVNLYLNNRSIRRLIVWLILLYLIAVVAACKNVSQSSDAKSETKVVKIQMGAETVSLEIAADEESVAKGLMNRERLENNSGMLFVFPYEGIYPFWMKNTIIPLSIAFVNSYGIIIDIQTMQPLDTLTHYAPDLPFRYAIEMDSGWFSLNHVKSGDTLQIPYIPWGSP